jgi:hypothetical protein
MTDSATIINADARLVRLPVDPPRGDAIQKFDALELPIVKCQASMAGVGGARVSRRRQR